MSTKIYNAYRYTQNLESLLMSLRRIKRNYWKRCSGLVSILHEGGKPTFKVYDMLREAMKSGMNDPLNFQASAVIYLNRNIFYVQFFGMPSRWIPPKKTYVDFHYQDQCDWPENMSKKEWEERRKTWEEIYGENCVCPGEAGLTFSILEEFGLFTFFQQYEKNWKEREGLK